LVGAGTGFLVGREPRRGGHGILVALHWEAAGGRSLRSPTLAGPLEPTRQPFDRGSPGGWRSPASVSIDRGWHCSGGHSASDTVRRLFSSIGGRVGQRAPRCGTTTGLPRVGGRRIRGGKEYPDESMESPGAGRRSGRRAYASVRSPMRAILPAPSHSFPGPPDR